MFLVPMSKPSKQHASDMKLSAKPDFSLVQGGDEIPAGSAQSLLAGHEELELSRGRTIEADGSSGRKCRIDVSQLPPDSAGGAVTMSNMDEGRWHCCFEL